MATASPWDTVVWEKLNEVGKWCSYSAEVCHFLEQATKRNLSTVWLGDADVNLKLYHVKLTEFVQISEATGIHFPIRRRRRCFAEDSALSTGIIWQWSGDRHNTWHNYDADVTNYIEEAYKKGKESVDLSERFPDYNYKLNLRKMEQRNKRNKGRRIIRRAPSSPFPVVKCSADDAKRQQPTDTVNCCDFSTDDSSALGTSKSGSSPVKVSSKPLIKHVTKLWSKLKKPVDIDSDEKSDKLESSINKKQCTDSINNAQMGTSSNHISYIANMYSHQPNISHLMLSAGGSSTNKANNGEESTYAIVNGKPWYHHWAPHVNESELKPVPGVNIPTSFLKRSGKRKGSSNVNIGNDVESVLNQFTEKIQILTIEDEADKECVICFENLFADSSYSDDSTVVKLQLCRHIFHKSCLKAMYESGNKDGCIQCPVCKTIHGEKCGTQPPGTMVFHVLPYSLPGYSNCDTIRIIYDIPPGVQGPEHPQPGRRFTARGFPRRCYLPDNEDGRKVLKLLVKAWERRLIFTVGSSSTTGEENTVTWNEIHHKTEFGSNKYGHGFPDPNYFENILLELAAHGVTESESAILVCSV